MTSIPAGKGSDFALTLAMTQCLVGSAASQSPPPASVRPYLSVFRVTCATGGLRNHLCTCFAHVSHTLFADSSGIYFITRKRLPTSFVCESYS